MQPLNQSDILQPQSVQSESNIQASDEKSKGIEIKDLSKKMLWAITGVATAVFSCGLLFDGVKGLQAKHYICKSLSTHSEINDLFRIKEAYLPCMASNLGNYALLFGTGLIAARVSYSCFKKASVATKF